MRPWGRRAAGRSVSARGGAGRNKRELDLRQFHEGGSTTYRARPLRWPADPRKARLGPKNRGSYCHNRYALGRPLLSPHAGARTWLAPDGNRRLGVILPETQGLRQVQVGAKSLRRSARKSVRRTISSAPSHAGSWDPDKASLRSNRRKSVRRGKESESTLYVDDDATDRACLASENMPVLFIFSGQRISRVRARPFLRAA